MTFNHATSVIFGSILLILIMGVCPTYGSDLDSLRTEEIDGKLFIIHQVDQGETLFAISRRYQVSIPDIIVYNPAAQLNLEISILLKIPIAMPEKNINTTGTTAHIVETKETLFSLARQYQVSISDMKTLNNLSSNEISVGQTIYIPVTTPPTVEPIELDAADKLTHSLQQGETLYSLSKKYEVSVDQLKTWNKLSDNTLSIGQLLIVGEKVADNNTTKKDTVQVIAKDSIILKDDSSSFASKELSDTTQTSKRGTNINGFDEIVETGIGELIPGSTENRKYLGLHHTAKIGTIMKVRNEMNDKIVFVRIIGRIPNTGDNKKVLLKISKAAYDSLGIIDPRFRVEVSYML